MMLTGSIDRSDPCACMIFDDILNKCRSMKININLHLKFSKGGNLLKFDQIGFGSEFDAPGTFAQPVQSVFYRFYSPEKPLYKRVRWSRFLAKNAPSTLCLKGCNICLQEVWRVKVGLMSPWNIGKCPKINKEWFSCQLFLCDFDLNPKMIYFLKSYKKWVLNLSSSYWDSLS